MPVGPGVASSEGRNAARGPAARVVVPIGLALAGLTGLLAALMSSRRKQAPRPTSDPGQAGTEGYEGQASSHGQVSTEGRASTADGPTRSGWYGAAVLALAAVVCAAVSVYGYNWLNRWYRPVGLTVTGNSQSNGQQIALTRSHRSAVRWGVAGYVGQLTVTGPPGGSAEIMLPVPVSQCRAVRARLGLARGCGAGGLLALPSHAEFIWSTPQELVSEGGSQTASSLDLEPSTGADGAQSVIMSMNGAYPTLCLYATLGAKLTITVGAHSYPATFTRFTVCDGITAVIGTPGSTPPVLQLGGIDGVTLTGSAPAGTLQGFTGQVTLTPGGTSVSGSAAVVSLSATGAGLAANLQIKPGSQMLSVTAHAATSVRTVGGQLVPSEWSREADVLGPLLGGFVTATVVAPLGVSVGVLTDALKRWRGPRWRRKKEARGES